MLLEVTQNLLLFFSFSLSTDIWNKSFEDIIFKFDILKIVIM